MLEKFQEKCRKCGYWENNGDYSYCDYYFVTGRWRPVLAAECKIYLENVKIQKKKPQSIRIKRNKGIDMAEAKYDTEKALALYREGLNDTEIAAEMGISRKTAYNFRYARKLPPIIKTEEKEVKEMGIANKDFEKALEVAKEKPKIREYPMKLSVENVIITRSGGKVIVWTFAGTPIAEGEDNDANG